jgi:hypothetical protein
MTTKNLTPSQFMKQIKGERIAKLQTMRDTIKAKLNAMRNGIAKESPYKRIDKDSKAIAWDILVNDFLLVDANIHNAQYGYVDVEAIRSQVSRSSNFPPPQPNTTNTMTTKITMIPINAIHFQIERIKRCVSCQHLARSFDARNAIEESLSWLDDAKGSVSVWNMPKAKNELMQAKIALSDGLAIFNSTQEDSSIAYNLGEGIKAIDGIIVLYFAK